MKMANKLKVLDLFSGIGGFSLGLEKTGLYETTAFCEWDKKCQEVLSKHWPNVEVFSDVSDLEGVYGEVMFCYSRSGAKDGLYDLYISRPVDVITGGFPCQDISNSGTKQGISGPRSGYWNEFARLIKEIKQMSQHFNIEAWEKYFKTSIRSGMMRNGTVSQLPTLVPYTRGTGCGSLPTPLASDNKNRGNLSNPCVKRRQEIGKQVSLSMHFKGNPCPMCVEIMMAFPETWTE